MDDDPLDGPSPSRFARLFSDPLQVRRWARSALLIATLASGLGWALLDGPSRSLVLALSWIAAFPIAAGLGLGNGFFIEHGRGLRRAIVTIVAGTFVVLLSCILVSTLSTSDDGWLRRGVSGGAYALLFAAIVLILGGILGIAFGRGGAYLARRIQQVDDEGW